jgi:methyltransferase (TIGR00027 family)
MSVNYNHVVSNLMKALPFVNNVAIIEKKTEIVYSTKNWDLRADIHLIISTWESMKPSSIIVSKEVYILRQFTIDRLVASSKGGHIIGVRDKDRIMISQIEPDGIIPFTTMEMARALASLNQKKAYLYKKEKLTQINPLKSNTISLDSDNKQKIRSKESSISFTARLMAHYRAQESKHDSPLIIDPFAERLAGDLTSYFKNHIRYSEMDYPLVRSAFIEESLLKPWCEVNAKSQIMLLGAGLDTRAYRFQPLKVNEHIIFELDFPELIQYKEKILHDETPLCKLVRLSSDLSNFDWISDIIKSGFNNQIPTFWIMEGLVYYIEEEIFEVLLNKIAEINALSSQIFVDIMHSSRWTSFPSFSSEVTTDPIYKHLKWGLNIKEVPSFFAKKGWQVTCSFADEYARDRNVGQKVMIFVYGTRFFLDKQNTKYHK